ncbi:inheritance of peroxisomes protein 1-domain-containing protein [Dipodascopsis tothii]|uniref:inheritance of peroxisomes protein 1-domain-containing protein n=1 Tax=Dipodascopsis tothii TaxID=44089 RepID=UPI0034CFF470
MDDDMTDAAPGASPSPAPSPAPTPPPRTPTPSADYSESTLFMLYDCSDSRVMSYTAAPSSLATLGRWSGKPPESLRTTEITIARGQMQIYKIEAHNATFLKCGGVVHPLMKRLRCWRTTPSQFVFPLPTAGKYWRVEVQADDADLELLHTVLRQCCSVVGPDGRPEDAGPGVVGHTVDLEPTKIPRRRRAPSDRLSERLGRSRSSTPPWPAAVLAVAAGAREPARDGAVTPHKNDIYSAGLDDAADQLPVLKRRKTSTDQDTAPASQQQTPPESRGPSHSPTRSLTHSPDPMIERSGMSFLLPVSLSTFSLLDSSSCLCFSRSAAALDWRWGPTSRRHLRAAFCCTLRGWPGAAAPRSLTLDVMVYNTFSRPRNTRGCLVDCRTDDARAGCLVL